MSDSRLIAMTNNNNEGQVVVDWTQVLDDTIWYDTNNEEEQEEQAWLEAKRVEGERAKAKKAERERAEAEKAAQEAKEKRAEAGAGATSGEAGGEVKRVVMDPGCTCCSWAKVICEFLMDSNKKWVACVCCNQSKGKCQWPRDGKDAEADPKATSKVNKGKKRKADDKTPEPRPSQKKQAKSKLTKVLEIDKPKASGSGARKAIAGGFLGLEDKLEQLIDAVVKNSGWITDVLEAIIDESYSFGVVVTPLDSGLSELNSDELHKEAEWLQAKGEEEEAEGEDEPMAE
ncbi:hypothetical protein M404DRAFT_23863 [Pisolithus tinctorius Marx 270]|uniref:Uncharacterized protein n=1 Tax=Pisolithus tinctorius Marx 270 TaxID=870435 RepID=A0A0C3KCQ4_PISTI|nr:hypothetical protein M404DRAFT_35616 [Pisolithus tinctorius Marx 270]KIO07377.1 hypothetical protein M404DRAFT_23863 [Pisolithus tinctorius Marx 270]